ncbi:HD domain-containing protein [Streptacidiphilus sp. EB129]|uniref:HD domain-containing protein n=1 Tax=Streptacidiphilus sp. EB129 TaxID=3156262 RepID=UPI0035183E36
MRGLGTASAVRASAGALLLWSALAVALNGAVDLRVAAAFGAFMVVGELVRTPLPGDRQQAPLGAAAALAYALLGSLGGLRTHHGVAQVVLLCGGAMLLGLLPSLAAGVRLDPDLFARRILTVAVAAALFQPCYNSGMLDRLHLPGPVYAMLLTGDAACAALVDVLLAAALRSERSRVPPGRAVRDELAALVGIGTAIVATGMVVSLAAGEIGLWALPLFSAPLLLSQVSFRRYTAILATQRQTVASLARATEVAGYTLPGHARRVASLAGRIGRELALGERELLLLEYAALMHDIGQLSLVDPVPGGATALLPVAEQRRIGQLGSEVIRQTGVPPQVAETVALLAEPYRRADGRRDPGVPRASAIIRVANAFDDLVCDDGCPARQREVLEQLRQDTALLYEPAVVDALGRVLLAGAGG